MESRTAWQQQIKGHANDLLFFYFKPKGVILLNIFTLFGTIAINNESAMQAIDETNNSAKNLAGSLDGASSSAVQSGGKIGGAFQKVSGAAGKVVSKVGAVAKTVGKTVAAGAAVGAAAFGKLAKDALFAAGELEQNMGGSEQVFQEHAKGMQETAKNAFSSMGLNTSEYLATANKMGALMQGAGLSIEESADLSAAAMQRAADVASIMGIDTASAMESIAGAAKGNFTMMDNLGVAMNATTLEAYALSKGMKTAYQDMDNATKVQLAMEMFLEKTTYAAGNYAKENETIAGSLATAKAAFTNFLNGSGNADALAKSLSGAMSTIGSSLMEIVPRLAEGIPDFISGIIPAISEGLSSAFSAIGFDIPADSIAGALFGAFEGALQVFDTVKGAVMGVVESIGGAISSIVDSASGLDFFSGAFDGVLNVISAVGSGIQTIVGAIGGAISGMIGSVGDGVGNLGSLFGGLSGMISDVAGLIAQAFGAIGEVVGFVIQQITTEGTTLNTVFTMIASAVSFVWESIVTQISGALDTITGVFSALKAFMSGDVVGAFEILKNAGMNSLKNMQEQAVNMLNFLKNIAGNILEAISGRFDQMRNMASGIISAIQSIFNVELSFPKIKLPHLSISGSFSFDPPSVPSISIEWYKKGGVLTDPTIFGFNPHTGSAMVGGEAGAEAIAPIDVLQGYVAQAVASQNADIVPLLSKIHDAIVDMSDKMGDSMRNAVDGMSFSMDNRKFGRLVKDVM